MIIFLLVYKLAALC